jgi:hypothetical protein
MIILNKRLLPITLGYLFGIIFPIFAGGPYYVTGPNARYPGQPYRWPGSIIHYYTDRGSLGNQSNFQANDLVAAAFQVWQNVDTANISFQNSGQLGDDVTSSNIRIFQNSIGNCSDPTQPANSIVYDMDGSMMSALGLDNNSVLGFSGIVCTDDTAGLFTRGWSLLNGRFIDGQPDSSSHHSTSLENFKGAFVHEFGHLIGLGHSQINLNCLTDSPCTTEDLAGIPVMFPVILDNSQMIPNTDDKASLSMLYPNPGFSASTARIQGHVLFGDGITAAQGYNVIARQAGSARNTAVSCVSGYLFTAAAGNPLVPDGNDVSLFFGSHDTNLIGYYDISGLPPGDYTVEVETINNSGISPFVGDLGVGPIGEYLGFQYKMPGSCSTQYLHTPSSPGDDCSVHTTLTLSAGQTARTNTDVILLRTPPRYDAWEDEP